MVHQVSHQQMKRKEAACEKEVVHRMQIDAANRGENEQYEKEKQQRYRGESADSACERSRLQFLRKRDPYFVAGYQILVTPNQLRAAADFVFLRRRKGIAGKIETFEVRGEPQLEITNLAHFVAKTVVPGIQALRAVTDAKHRSLMRRNCCASVRLALLVFQRKRRAVHGENHVVVNRLLGRQVKRESHVARLIAEIYKFVRARELHLVGAVPKKALPTVIGVQRRIHATFLKGERDITPVVDRSQNFF